MAPRTVYANLPDGLQLLSLWDQSLADMGSLGVIPCTASGSNAITLTPIASEFPPNVTNPPGANQLFSFVATATSTGAVTISIAGVTSFLKLYRMDAATQAASGDIQNTVTYVISFNSALNSAAGGFQIQSPVNNEINPVITGATISNSTLSGCTITTSTYNGNTWTAGTGTLTIAALKTLTANSSLTLAGVDGKTLTVNNSLGLSGVDGKTLTVNNSLALAGTDSTTMTFPTTSATIARTDAGQTFTGTNAFGVLTATTVNGNTFTSGSYTLTGTAGKTLNFTNSLTLSGTDSTTMTFPTTSATLARTDAGNTFTGTQNFVSLTASSAVATDGSKNLVSVTNTGSGNNVLATAPTLNQAILNGVTTNTTAGAGVIGQVISSTVLAGSAVSLVTGTAKDVTTISLTAGNWLVWGNVSFTFNSTATTTVIAYINTTANTLPTVPNGGAFNQQSLAFPNANQTLPTGMMILSLSGTTTVSLGSFASFSSGTQAAYGFIGAMRFF